jgi:transposase
VLSLPPSVRLFVATQPVDGRKGADSLMVVVYWDRNGFAMWTKRLKSGRFRPTFSADSSMTPLAIEAAELALIIEGIDLAGARRRRRWEPARPA